MLVEVAPATVKVHCRKCRLALQVTHEMLRDANDGYAPLPCPRCDLKALGKKPKPSRTGADIIVLATNRLDRGDGVDLSDLIVMAWTMDKARFGLPGYLDVYPSSKRVECEVQNSLRKWKHRPAWLVRVEPCRYRLTEVGEVWAKQLASASAKSSLRAATVGKSSG